MTEVERFEESERTIKYFDVLIACTAIPEKRIKKLEEALEYYADESVYGMTTGGAIYMRATQPWLRARKVLEDKND